MRKGTKKIKFEDLMKEIRRLGKKSPNNEYKPLLGAGCSYLRGTCSDGSIGCIFGQAFKNLEVSIRKEEEFEEIRTILDLHEIKTVDDQKWWALDVQEYQDRGATWEEAIVQADSKSKRRKNYY